MIDGVVERPAFDACFLEFAFALAMFFFFKISFKIIIIIG